MEKDAAYGEALLHWPGQGSVVETGLAVGTVGACVGYVGIAVASLPLVENRVVASGFLE